MSSVKPASAEAVQLFMEGFETFSHMEANGMRIDVPYLNSAIERTGKLAERLEREIKEDEVWKIWKKRFGSDAGLSKREQLGSIIFEDLGVECKKRTATGKPSTDQEAFEVLDFPFVKKWVSLQALEHLRSTNLLGFRDHIVDGWLRPCFNLHKVITFRGSCSDPNGQNIPNREPRLAKIVRPMFIPRSEEYVIIESDFSGNEVKSAATYHHDPRMIRYLKEDYDLHLDMAAECYKLERDQVSKPIRGAAKGMFVFAAFFGDWYHKICQNLWWAVDHEDLRLSDGTKLREHLNSVGLTSLGDLNPKKVREGTFEAHIRDVESSFWGERFNVYSEWKERHWQEYLKNGYFRYHTGFVSQGVFSKNQAINAPIQGTAFHWLLWTLIQLDKWFRKYKMKSKLIGQIHDSMIVDCHRSELQDVLHKIKSLVTVELTEHWPWINVPLANESSVCEQNWFLKKEWIEKGGTWIPKPDKK